MSRLSISAYLCAAISLGFLLDHRLVAQYPIGVSKDVVNPGTAVLLWELNSAKELDSFAGELELSSEQIESVKSLLKKFDTQLEQSINQRLALDNGLLSVREIKKIKEQQFQIAKEKTKELRFDAVKEIESLLLPDQMKRLRQMALRQELLNRSGGDVVKLFSLVSPHLALSKLKKKEFDQSIQKLAKEYQQESLKLRKKYSEQIARTLPQKKSETMNALLGDEFAEKDAILKK